MLDPRENLAVVLANGAIVAQIKPEFEKAIEDDDRGALDTSAERFCK